MGSFKPSRQMMSLYEIQGNVIDSAIYALCGSASITAHCRHDADTLVLVWAMASGNHWFERDEIESKVDEAYNYFEFGEAHPEWGPKPEWAIWDYPLSPSPS